MNNLTLSVLLNNFSSAEWINRNIAPKIKNIKLTFDIEHAIYNLQNKTMPLILVEFSTFKELKHISNLIKNNNELDDISIIAFSIDEVDLTIQTNALNLGMIDFYIFSEEKLEFEIKKLKLNIDRMILQEGATQQKVLNFNGIIIDPNKFYVKIEGKSINLTKSEFFILYQLLKKPGWTLSRYDILQYLNTISSNDKIVGERVIDFQIFNLRKKLKNKQSIIKTVRGVGYKVDE